MAFSLFRSFINAVEHPVTAYNNISKRTAQYAQSGYSLPDTLKYAFTPQSAYAHDTTQGLDYRNQAVTPAQQYAAQYSTPPPSVSPQAHLPQVQTLSSVNRTTSPSSTFSATYFHGQPYMSAQSLADAQIRAAQAGTQAPSFSTVYNAQTYTDPHSYYQALLGDATTQHNNAITAADKAYKEGLISFDERQKAIDLSRQNVNTQLADLLNQYNQNVENLGRSKTQALSGVAGYFSNISPYAYQSAQGGLENQTNQQFAQDLSGIEQQKMRGQQQGQQNLDLLTQNEADLNRARTNYGTDYANQLKAIDAALQNQKDTYANQENQTTAQQQAQAADQQSKLQDYIDQVKNNLGAYNASVSSAQTANAGNATQAANINPLDVAFSFAKPYYETLQALGNTPDAQAQAQSRVASGLAQNNIKATPDLLNYLYGLFGTPSFQNAFGYHP